MTNDLLPRLRAADPVTPESLDALVPRTERRRIRDGLVATPRGGGGRRERRRLVTTRRVLIAGTAAVVVAAVAVTAGVVSRPDHVGGPTTASAAEILHAAATTARDRPDYVLTGTERVYSGYLGRVVNFDSGPAAGGKLRLNTDVYSGEWWTDARGAFLLRTRTYSKSAAAKLGIAVGGSDWFRQSAHPTDGSEQPMTYAQLRAIPTDPAGLTRYLRRHIDQTDASDPRGATGATGVAINLLTQPLAPAALRGAVYDLLADLPGVTDLGTDHDVFGRTGVLIGYPVGASALTSGKGALLIDPATATALEERGPLYTEAELRKEYGPGVTIPADRLGKTRTFVGPTVVGVEREVPPGVSVAPPASATSP